MCEWLYDATRGDPENDIPPGTPWHDLPSGWVCPVCGADQEEFSQVPPPADFAPANFSNTASTQAKSAPVEATPAKPAPSTGFYLSQWERKLDEREPEFRTILAKALSGEESVSAMRPSRWQNLLEDVVFLPAQLARSPLDYREATPDLSVTIGPAAKKPLTIGLPFYVSDMSFGSISKEAKIALAKGSAATGTAIFGGEGGLLEEEYQAARFYVFEYSTGRFGVTDENLKKSHAIQIKIGQAAKAGLGGHLLAAKVTDEIVAARGVKPGQDIISPARHEDITTPRELAQKVAWLKEKGEGTPVGVKISTGWIERDLEVALAAGVDFITLDARGGSTGAAPDHIKDNVCIPLPYALARTRQFLDRSGKREEVSLLVAGGVRTSADIAKCLAMGADAVGLATAALIGIGCQQYRICHRGSCPVGIATQNPDLRSRFDVEKSAAMLTSLFQVYSHEVEDYVRICGKRRVADLAVEDLASLTLELAQGTGLSFCGLAGG
ncbi:MAG: rubredoxin [Magnetococcales bacterium]|nr:rubredoxin [Magnetococcales bacterium]